MEFGDGRAGEGWPDMTKEGMSCMKEEGKKMGDELGFEFFYFFFVSFLGSRGRR